MPYRLHYALRNLYAVPMCGYEEEYFTSLYGTKARQTLADRLRDAKIRRIVADFAPPQVHLEPLLDVGCGYGFLLERFAEEYSLFGVDISEHAIAVAAQRLPSGTLAVADIEEGIPFQEKFRAILLVNVLEHLHHPERAAEIVYDALRPGGLCVVHLPTINNRCSRLYYDRSYAKDPSHIYRPSARQVSELFQGVGFQPVIQSFAPHIPGWLWRLLRPFPPFLAAYRKS